MKDVKKYEENFLRRNFFKSVAEKILPILGAITLTMYAKYY